MSIEAAIFDYSVLIARNDTLHEDVDRLLSKLQSHGIKIGLFSSRQAEKGAEILNRNFPLELALSNSDVGANKGSPQWFRMASERLNTPVHKMVFFGDSVLDWRTAINSAVWYINAEWTNGPVMPHESIRVENPYEAWLFLSHYLMGPPRWQYSYDEQEPTTWHFRSLLNASSDLPCTSVGTTPAKTFSLQDILTYERHVQVGNHDARHVLMTHAFTSLYLEGLIPSGVFICPYPGHSAESNETLLDEWFEPAAKLFHGWYKRDLFERVANAPDTSRLRAQRSPVTPDFQMSTVRINPEFDRSIAGRTVILLDDFTTEGYSLEWGRHLLHAAGAKSVILISIGKYGRHRPIRHGRFKYKGEAPLNPYEVTKNPFRSLFLRDDVNLTEDTSAPSIIDQSLAQLSQNKALYYLRSGEQD